MFWDWENGWEGLGIDIDVVQQLGWLKAGMLTCGIREWNCWIFLMPIS